MLGLSVFNHCCVLVFIVIYYIIFDIVGMCWMILLFLKRNTSLRMKMKREQK
uniref:Uncharacterized protein n=1 Tax=Solanum lycopersicum TaxID=4081 RepID=A0A3Q7EZL4_SOLLC